MPSIKSKFYEIGMQIYGSTVAASRSKLEKHLRDGREAVPTKLALSKFDINKLMFENKYFYYIVKEKDFYNQKNIVIYIHGGGFILPITHQHMLYTQKIAKACHAIVYVLLYPLSTKKYSGCIDDNNFIRDFYRKLLKTYDPKNITIVGDSAGGTLVLTSAYQIKLAGLPIPQNLIAISPCSRLNFSRYEVDAFADLDPVLPRTLFVSSRNWYVSKLNGKDPRVNPYFCDLSGMNNILITTGTNEAFYIHTIEFAEKQRRAGVNIKLIIGKKMFHVFPLFDFLEANVANQHIFTLIKSNKANNDKFDQLKPYNFINK
jgi:acetyl esterase/lipase